MSDGKLYEIARERVDARYRRRKLWALDLGGLLFSLALLVLLGMAGSAVLGTVIFFAWCGVFVVHTVLLRLAEARASDIEEEVARLRDAVYEKPKRLEVADDGELIEWSSDDEAEMKARHER